MRRETTRERFQERLRLLQVYETFLRYGADAVFGRRALGEFRRRMQTWAYQTKQPVERLSAPVKTRLLLQELGPTYVKFGQIVSSRADSVPQDWERELAKLQSDVQPFPVEEARAVVESELGAPPEQLYASFDPVPLAAASLGQVHRATLEDGREVVVKVQRPRIEAKVRSDLRILAQAARTLERRTAWARELGARQMIDEFGETLLRELDYTIEAYNARRLAQNLASIEGVHIPEMIRHLCSRRVLTMEYVDGVVATRRDEIIAAGLDPVAIADVAVRASIKMLLIDGFFHADPHPGNVLVSLDTGILTFLDTGMVGTLTLRQRFALVNLLETAGERDPLALAQALRGLSEPMNGTPSDPQGFDREFVEAEAPLLDVEEGERLQLARMMGDAVDLLHEHGLRPDPQLSVALKAMMQAEEFTKVLYPPGSSGAFVEKATQMSRELVEEAVTKDAVAGFARKQASFALRQAAQNLPSLQDVAQMWLRQLGAGKFQVAIDTSDLDPQIERIEDSTRVVTVALMLVGLLIASAIAATAGVSGSLEPLQRFALVTYAVSAVVVTIVVLAMGRRLLRRERGGRG
jgi:ubiquinone biosynthesis protein